VVVRMPVGRERAARRLGASDYGIILIVGLPSALPDIVNRHAARHGDLVDGNRPG
jgi:hypothetical protein